MLIKAARSQRQGWPPKRMHPHHKERGTKAFMGGIWAGRRRSGGARSWRRKPRCGGERQIGPPRSARSAPSQRVGKPGRWPSLGPHMGLNSLGS